jgi:TP901 family phage tail tape measure protein
MASARNTSLSINLVMNSAINGANFLQASVNKLVSPARKLEKFDFFKATKFGLLNKNVKSLENHLGKLRSQSAKISANPIRLDIKTSRTSLKEARKDMTAIEHDAKQVAFYTKKASENLRAGATAQNKSMHKKAKSSQSSSSIVGALGIATAIALPFKASIDFESNMARVGALANVDKKSVEFKALKNTALELGRETEWSANQVAKALQYTSMAGLSANESIAAMPGLLNLATAGATDLATTSNIATNILGGFDFKATDMIDGMNAMTYVSDIMAKTLTTSNVDMQMLGDTMKYVSPVAKKAGMSLQETSAMAGLLGNIGINGSQAGTTLKSMLSRLAAPPTEARKALDKLGLSTKDLQGNLKSMPLLLAEVSKATAGMGNADQLKYMSKIFGLEPMAGASKLVDLAGTGELEKYLSIVNEYKGSAKKIADAQLDTVAGQMKILGSAFQGLSLSATDGLMAPLKAIVIGITSVVSSVAWITNTFPLAGNIIVGLCSTLTIGTVALTAFGFAANIMSGSLKSGILNIKLMGGALKTGVIFAYKSALTILSFTAKATGGVLRFMGRSAMFMGGALKTGVIFAYRLALAGLSVVGRGIGGVLTSAIGFIRSFSLATTLATAKQWLFNVALNANPIGLIVLGIGALVTAGVLLYQNWDIIKSKAVSLWNGISSAFSSVYDFIKVIGVGIKNTFIAMFSWSPIGLIVNNWGKIGAYFSNIATMIKKPFVSFFDWISSKFKAVFGLIDKAKSVVNAPIDAVKSGASKLWSGTKSFFSFGGDKKEPIKSKIPKAGVPVNNVDFKSSSLKEAQIAQVPLESVSDVTAGAINETKSFMQNNTNNTQGVNQNITNHITVHAPAGGQVDYEDLKIKLAMAQKELSQEDTDLQMQDAS